MNLYVSLVSSLPLLRMTEAPLVSYGKFMADCEGMLDAGHLDMLRRFSLVPGLRPGEKQQDAAQKLIGCLPAVLKKNSSVQLGRGFAAGFKIGFNDSEVFLDFSDEALAEVICEFVGPKLAAVIKS